MPRDAAGYSINVAGSLMGSLVLRSVISRVASRCVARRRTRPALLLLPQPARTRPAFYFVATVVGALVFGIVNPAIWSHITGSPCSTAPSLRSAFITPVNYDGFQALQDLSREHLSGLSEPERRSLQRHYDVPYSLAARNWLGLILGGGGGNDAAAALRNGATKVDVVEIDPVIARIGRTLHPEAPYASKDVTSTSRTLGLSCRRRTRRTTWWCSGPWTATPRFPRFPPYGWTTLSSPEKAFAARRAD